MKAETEENLATINALANQLKEGVSISQSKDLSNLELSVTDQEIAIATAKWQKQPEEKEQEKPKQEQLKEQVATGEVGGEPERGPTEPTKLNNQGEVKTAVVVDQKLQTPVVVANEVGDAVVPPIPATQPVIQPHVADPNQSDADTQSQGASSTINPSGTGNPSPTGTPTPWSQWFWNGAVTFFTFLKNKLFWWW
ncbi:hypothetical protein IPH67_01580 [bacterium]|nr:MAG: hypothetical protein IPH67_01580 [bacterium]